MKRIILLVILMVATATTARAAEATDAAPQPGQEAAADGTTAVRAEQPAPERPRNDRERKKTKAKMDEDLRKLDEMRSTILKDMEDLEQPEK